MRGKLFSHEFLFEGIRETAAWRALGDDAVASFRSAARAALGAVPPSGALNEAATETEVIFPVLRALGWAHSLTQQAAAARGREDVPDVLLFGDEEAKRRALHESSGDRKYRHGLAIVESKRWDHPLDRGADRSGAKGGAPSSQMLRYLTRVEVASDRAITFGILTNGRLWRLYWQGARSRSEDFLELDLARLVDLPGLGQDLWTALEPEVQRGDHLLRAFLLAFRRQSFLPDPQDAEGRTFHRIALDEGKHWEERISHDLGRFVFDELFPRLVRGLAEADREAPRPLTDPYLGQVRRAALTFLYRLLFVLYAEDRSLLPVRDPRYRPYSLKAMREEVAARIDAGDVLAATARRTDLLLRELFRVVDRGEPSMGMPPYNGGLFAGDPLLDRVLLPDSVLIPLVDGLSRRGAPGERRWIHYRDLSVQQLGSVYERILEHRAVVGPAGGVEIRLSPFARKGSGSYYTHDALVRLVVDRTLSPLIGERVEAFRARAEDLSRDRRPKAQRLADLARHDPAAAILDLKVCDPAMGSGHFLVSLVDYLADHVLEQMADAPARVGWTGEGAPYVSPVEARISALRGRVLEHARAEGWTVDPEQLDDRHLVRRMILKRVVFGVDKNPMAVELAKVSLWLHTFTVGAPLSFLDHHLRPGDSLYGEWLGPAIEELASSGSGALYVSPALAGLSSAARLMVDISQRADADLAEVSESRTFFATADESLRPIRRFLDFWHALRWMGLETRGRRAQSHRPLWTVLTGAAGNVLRLADTLKYQHSGVGNPLSASALAEVEALLGETRRVADREGFVHWELAFPDVWPEPTRAGRRGGFDAVIGNPPWDRMKHQEVEWFAERRPEVALASKAADRKRMVEALREAGDPLWDEQQAAADRASRAGQVARGSGEYPLLSGGDVNLYSLFVERAARLVHSRGVVGLLVPSGIGADRGASDFFRGISTTGHLGAMLDFENRGRFFPDVHASFKFCALVFGGAERHFEQSWCGSYLHDVAEVADPDRVFPLAASDFSAVNPNTGTAPVFRTRRDAEITAAVYRRHPVLVDRRDGGERRLWPVRYATMFHMTNDSHLFRTREELEEEGFYPVGHRTWRRGAAEYVPLFEGKMVQAYDHRAASVVVNPNNVHRPAQPQAATLEQHRDPGWYNDPQYWVPSAAVDRSDGVHWTLCFKEITAPTNVRTVIACAAPRHGFGNKVPVLLSEAPHEDVVTRYRALAPCLLANLNSLPLDFIARQKVHGQTINLFILEQLALIHPDEFGKRVGGHLLSDFIRDQVLHLTYTSHDMRPFAEDMGCAGPPFEWDEEDRRHRIARLDALFFHLYGIGLADAEYVLGTFPIVREEDECRFGRYLTRDLVLAYMRAVGAGDLDSVVQP